MEGTSAAQLLGNKVGAQQNHAEDFTQSHQILFPCGVCSKWEESAEMMFNFWDKFTITLINLL